MQFTIKSKKGVGAILLLLLAFCFLYSYMTFNTSTVIENETANSPTSELTLSDVPVKEAQTVLPDYDLRNKIKINNSTLTHDTDFDENKALEEGQAEIDNLIAAYEESLTDPEVRQAIAQKLKASSDEYKKAILVKLAKNEL